MARSRRKISLKKVLCLILVGVVAVTVIGGIAAFAKKDTETLSSTIFSRGGLDENGEYVASEQTLYTEQAFNCIGLRVVPDFDAQLTYDVYYYDYDDNLLDTKLGLKKTYDEDHPHAKMARIVIHPDIPEGTSEKDFKIGFLDVYKYASKLTITVDKTQNYLYANSINLFDEETMVKNKTYHQGNLAVSEWNTLDASLVDYADCHTSNSIKINGEYDKYDIFVRTKESELPPDSWLSAVIADANGKVCIDTDGEYCMVSSNIMEINAYEWHKITIEVPEGANADHLRVTIPADVESCYIYGY